MPPSTADWLALKQANSTKLMGWVLLTFAYYHINPDSKVHGANMGPTWVLLSPGGPHVGPMNLAIWEDICLLQIPSVNTDHKNIRSFDSLAYVVQIHQSGCLVPAPSGPQSPSCRHGPTCADMEGVGHSTPPWNTNERWWGMALGNDDCYEIMTFLIE